MHQTRIEPPPATGPILEGEVFIITDLAGEHALADNGDWIKMEPNGSWLRVALIADEENAESYLAKEVRAKGVQGKVEPLWFSVGE